MKWMMPQYNGELLGLLRGEQENDEGESQNQNPFPIHQG
jgi:hypothetical protein